VKNLIWRRGVLLSLALIFGVKIAVANSEISETWQIEIEQTNRFVRTREYRLSGPRSLTWIYELYERDPEDFFSMKLGEPHPVAAWPVKKFSVEKDVPELDDLEFDPDEPSVFFNSLNRPFLGEQIGEIPGHFSLRDYIYGLVVDGRLPKRVRVEFEQTAYRAVCLVTVLSSAQSLSDSSKGRWSRLAINLSARVARCSVSSSSASFKTSSRLAISVPLLALIPFYHQKTKLYHFTLQKYGTVFPSFTGKL